jgi:hypothetical protein
MKALNNYKSTRKKKRAIVRFHKVRKFFLTLKNNPIAREFVLERAKEKGIEFNIDAELNDEFFLGLTDLMKLETIGCVCFNHKFFQFVDETNSIPYRKED